MTEIGSSVQFPMAKDKRDIDLFNALQDFHTVIISILNRGIKFSDNVDCVLVSFTSNGVANTEDAVSHTLGKVPTGFIVYRLDKAAVVYDSGTTWTTTNIYLKCNVASVAYKIIVF